MRFKKSLTIAFPYSRAPTDGCPSNQAITMSQLILNAGGSPCPDFCSKTNGKNVRSESPLRKTSQVIPVPAPIPPPEPKTHGGSAQYVLPDGSCGSCPRSKSMSITMSTLMAQDVTNECPNKECPVKVPPKQPECQIQVEDSACLSPQLVADEFTRIIACAQQIQSNQAGQNNQNNPNLLQVPPNHQMSSTPNRKSSPGPQCDLSNIQSSTQERHNRAFSTTSPRKVTYSPQSNVCHFKTNECPKNIVTSQPIPKQMINKGILSRRRSSNLTSRTSRSPPLQFRENTEREISLFNPEAMRQCSMDYNDNDDDSSDESFQSASVELDTMTDEDECSALPMSPLAKKASESIRGIENFLTSFISALTRPGRKCA